MYCQIYGPLNQSQSVSVEADGEKEHDEAHWVNQDVIL